MPLSLQNIELNVVANKYHVSIDATPGNGWSGEVFDNEADLILCVYDVCRRDTVDFLRYKVC